MAADVRLPDVLVLGGGGVVGEAWMSGLLAGIEDATALDLRDCGHFLGTSAGSMVAAGLAAGERPRRPAEPSLAETPRVEADGAGSLLLEAARLSRAFAEPLASLALGVGARVGALPRAALLSRIPAVTMDLADLGRRIGALAVSFDGRLGVVAVDRASGRRVVFGATGAPEASVAEAVQASCSIPGVFRPVQIGGRAYVDGGVWSPTSLDVAPAGRGDFVLCVTPTGRLPRRARSAMEAIRSLSGSATALEAAALRRRGVSVRTIAPDAEADRAMGPNLMDPQRRKEALAAGYRQGHHLAG